MMAQESKRSRSSSWGLLNNDQCSYNKATMLHAVENAATRIKPQQNFRRMKRKGINDRSEQQDGCHVVKRAKWRDGRQESEQQPCVSGQHKAGGPAAAMMERWEVDSGFSSESSPSVSGRSSPCLCPTMVVALDCEMVGTGPGGRRSELARCSVLDYHGNVLFDKYVLPSQPVTDYRTRWSGIQRHHLRNATPFAQAREEVFTLLEGKVVVGHSIYNDFEVLDMPHPCHMVRDTGATRLLSRLAGFPRGHCASLKVLACKLLNRRIQAGKRGHCSVEDALAALDLYKLVEGEWEQEAQHKLRGDDAPQEPSFASSNHYMQDEYWPQDLTAQGQ
ncbi:apoptosis-enhancing nuclease [Genypterus blacodes]|uniref:apoptosis-enhancing nuclease n=1 Tax=Genypterus blacodes TaxID=154954 RepID=UPI003F76467E